MHDKFDVTAPETLSREIGSQGFTRNPPHGFVDNTREKEWQKGTRFYPQNRPFGLVPDKLLNAVKGQKGMFSLVGRNTPMRDSCKVKLPHVSTYHH
jgi:hypothetical protein